MRALKWWAARVGVAAVLVGIAAAAVTTWWLGLILGVGLGASGWFALVAPRVRGADRRVLRLVGPVRSADGRAEARLLNLVEGLAPSAGVPRPRCLVIDDPAMNALAMGADPRQGAIVVTSGLLEGLSRMELEGVVAQLLVCLRDGATVGPTLALSLGRRLPKPGRGGGAPGGGRRATDADLGAVALTRYPPGLSSALASILASVAAGSGSVPPGSARALDALWLAPPGAEAALAARVGALDEL